MLFCSNRLHWCSKLTCSYKGQVHFLKTVYIYLFDKQSIITVNQKINSKINTWSLTLNPNFPRFIVTSSKHTWTHRDIFRKDVSFVYKPYSLHHKPQGTRIWYSTKKKKRLFNGKWLPIHTKKNLVFRQYIGRILF